MNWLILAISFIGSGFINKLKKKNWDVIGEKFKNKYVKYPTQENLFKLAWAMIGPIISVFELIFKFLIMGVIVHGIYKGVGIEEAVLFCFITIIIRLGFINQSILRNSKI